MASLAPTLPDEGEAIMEASPAHLLTRIKSFSLLDTHGIDKYETKEFLAGDYKWKLIIYPNGRQKEIDDDECYVSVDLAIANTTALPAYWEVNAAFSICLLNQISDNYHYSLGRKRFHAMKTEWGFSKFISKKKLTDPINGYLIDDNCVFGAEVFVVENKAITECLSLKNVRFVPYEREFKIPNFSTLECKWKSDEFTDGDCKWFISVYPNGNGEATGRSLSVFLNHVASQGERVNVCFTVRLKNQLDCNKHQAKTGSIWFSASGLGWNSFIELASLKDPKKSFIVNDCCLLEVELSVRAIAA